RQRQIPAWLVIHERCRRELEALFPSEQSRIIYVPDTWFHRFMWRVSRPFPVRFAHFTFGFAMRLSTQLIQRRIVRRIVRDHSVSVVHQPIPVSPKEPSMMFGIGAPVVIGPMNGGMDYPAGLRNVRARAENLAMRLARPLSTLMNWVIPGKRKAVLLLVANERTRAALPKGLCPRVITL